MLRSQGNSVDKRTFAAAVAAAAAGSEGTIGLIDHLLGNRKGDEEERNSI